MNELSNSSSRLQMRPQLLGTVSIMALVAILCENRAHAADTFLAASDHPSIWVELGGDVEQQRGSSDTWLPGTQGILAGAGIGSRKDPIAGLGVEGNISFQPQGTDWIASASIRYGRSQRQGQFTTQHVYGSPLFAIFYNGSSRHTENHMILDFKVGKDFGLGMLGCKGNSVLSVGVRIAQFNANSDDMVSSNPIYTANIFTHQRQYFHTANIQRRLSAIGPSLSWDGMTPVVSATDQSLTFDWGVVGAILFGKQTTHGTFENRYRSTNAEIETGSRSDRKRSAVIPNVGAFVGFSYRLPAAKLTIGYRGETYFNAIDGGVGTAHSITRSFYGPFATIGIGIGG